MGKGSGLAILALLIGIGGSGFGIYSYFTFSQTNLEAAFEILHDSEEFKELIG